MGDRAGREDDPTLPAKHLADQSTVPAGARAADRTWTEAGPRPASDRPVELPQVALEHYELGDEIAHGGMGRIRAARDLRIGREVAIKELLEPQGHAALRFEREAVMTARLQHPGIVSVYEAGRWPSGEPFFAMKLVRGRSLKKVIADAPDADARLALLPHVLAVADAMAYAHGQQVVHRDLKPANVLVGEFGETVVIDWGLAKDLTAAASDGDEPPAPRSSDASLTRAGSVLGTPNYMPPEQARGETVDVRADVYSIGAILYHLLAGEPPFLGADSGKVLELVTAQPPSPLAERAPHVAADLLAIVERAMARDARDRYPSARELAEDLRRFLTGKLVESHRYTRVELLRRFVRRHRVVLAVAAAAAVALAIIGGLSVQRIRVERDQARTERARADAERATAVARADQIAIERAAQLVEHDPAGALATLGAISPGSPLVPAMRVIAADAAARRIPRVRRIGMDVQLTDLAVSDDGTQLATGAEDGTVRVWDAATLTARVLSGHAQMSYVFTLAGGRLVTSSYDNTVRVWNLAGGEPVVLRHPGPVRALAASHDAAVIASVCDDRYVRVWDVAGNRLVRTLGDGRHDDVVWLSRDGKILVYQVGSAPPAVLELDTGREHALDAAAKLGAIAVLCAGGFCPDTQTIAVSADAEVIALVDAEGMLSVWDWRHDRRRVLGRAEHDPIARLALSPDATRIATSGSALHELRVWPIAGGPPRVLGTADETATLTFSPDGHLIAATGAPASVWDVETGAVTSLVGPTERASSLVFAAGDTVAGVAGSTLWAWPAKGSERVAAQVAAPVRQLAARADGSVIVGGGNGELRVGGRSQIIAGGVAGTIALAPDGTLAAILGTDDTVRLCELATGAVRTLGGPFHVGSRDGPADRNAWSMSPRPGSQFYSAIIRRMSRRVREREGWVDYAVFSPDGTTLATSHAEHGELVLWTLATGARRAVATGPADLEHVIFAPDGHTLYAGASDGHIHVIDVASGSVHDLAGHDAPIEGLAVTRDGRTLASASTDHTVRLWDLARGTSVVSCVLGAPVGQVLFAAGDQRLIAAADDGKICLWDVPNGSSRVLEGHRDAVLAIAISPDGATLASSDLGGVVRLWDLATGQARELDVPGSMVGALAFTPDGSHVLGGAADGRVWSWPDDLPRPEPQLRGWLTREAARSRPAQQP